MKAGATDCGKILLSIEDNRQYLRNESAKIIRDMDHGIGTDQSAVQSLNDRFADDGDLAHQVLIWMEVMSGGGPASAFIVNDYGPDLRSALDQVAEGLRQIARM